MDFASLEAVAQVVIDEVQRTTVLRMTFSPAPWFDDDVHEDAGTIYGVLHFADRAPVEEAFAPYGPSTDISQAVMTWERVSGFDISFGEMLAHVADSASDLVQVGLWQLGLDSSWPPCPEHDGRHPLRPVAEPLIDTVPVDRAVPMAATWRCYQPIVTGDEYQAAYEATAIPIGKLAILDGLAAVTD